MSDNSAIRVARITEIARHAGVSTATVDRVLNRRPHVKESTRQRVLQAKAAIESGTPVNDTGRAWRLKVILPNGAGRSTEFLAECIQAVGEQGNATIECVFAHKFDPIQLARKLRACTRQGIHGVAFLALDDPRVVDAVGDLALAQIPAVALLTGLEHAPLAGYIGINNRLAGRTAGFMMGHLTKTPGGILIVSGSELYRAHQDREMGFRAALRKDFHHARIVDSLTGRDDIEETYRVVSSALSQYPGLVGIYNVGGGNEGVVRALEDAGAEHEIVVIGHNLNPGTRRYLRSGSLDALIHINLQRAAHEVVGMLIAKLSGRRIETATLPVEIITRENTEGVVYG